MQRPRRMPVRRWTWSAPGWGTWPPPTPPSSPPRPRPSACANWSRHDAMATAARAGFLAAFTAGQGPRRGRGLQRGVLADPPHRHHPGRGRRAHARGPSGWPRIRGCWRRWPPGRSPESVGRVICLWTGKLPQEYRDAGDEQLLAAFAGGLGLADLAGLFAEMYVRTRGDLPGSGPGPGVRGPRGEAGHHHRRRRGPARRPDRRVRRRGGRGAGRAVRPGRERRRPDQGPAVPRRAGRGDAAADRGRACCRSGPGSRSRPGRTSPSPT